MQPLRPHDPTQVGPYRLLRRLGEGGMGEVFYGLSPSGREVAVKLIHRRHAESENFRKRFAREIEAARLVGGFYSPPVVDAGPYADPPWMVTAYIPGPSLHEKVTRDGPLGVEEVRALGAGLAEGLAAIHSHDLVHRDLKPGNVLMAEGGPRIIDFGIARALDASTMTSTGAFVGTYGYASPEQVDNLRVGPASDVFSLGGVLTFAATGRAPFAAGTPLAVARKIAGEPPDLSGIDGDLRDLIAECLAKDPGDRPPVADLLRRLTVPPTTPDEPRPRIAKTVSPADAAPGHRDAADAPQAEELRRPAERRATPDEPAIAPARDRAVAGRPVRAVPGDRRLAIGVIAGMLLVVALVAGIVVYFVPATADPAYQEGDNPRSVTHQGPNGCSQAPCPGPTVLDAYRWTLSAGATVTTTFTAAELSPQYIRGVLRHLAGNCHGSQVQWDLWINNAPVASGRLDEAVRDHPLNQPVPKKALFTIRVFRTDSQSCTIVFGWDHPQLRQPSFSER